MFQAWKPWKRGWKEAKAGGICEDAVRESVRPQLQLAHTAMAAERAIAVHWCCRPGRRRTSNVHLRALFLCVAGLALARAAGGDAATPPSAADPAVGPAAPKTFHVIWYAGGEMRAKSLSSDEACRRFTRGLGEGAPWQILANGAEIARSPPVETRPQVRVQVFPGDWPTTWSTAVLMSMLHECCLLSVHAMYGGKGRVCGRVMCGVTVPSRCNLSAN